MKNITICIPTYNQSKSLDKLLLQIYKFNKNNPIIVSDNGSNDGTDKVIKKYIGRIKNLNYYKLKKNFGFDYNYLNCVKKVKTKYFWVIGSDDGIYSSSLKNILKLIKNLKHPDGITFIDNKNYSNSFNKKEDIRKLDLLEYANSLGTISLNVVKKKSFNSNNDFIVKKNFGYIQVFYLVRSILRNNNWYIIKKNNISKINHFSIDKNSRRKNLTRLNNEIRGYNFFIENMLTKNNVNKYKYKDLIFKKNIRPWIVENLLLNERKDILKIINNNLKYLNNNFELKLMILIINIFPTLFLKFFIYIKRNFF